MLSDAAAEIGLDRDAVEHMLLQTDDDKLEVLQSYRDTIVRHHIHSIPEFTFNGPKPHGGRFRIGSIKSIVER